MDVSVIYQAREVLRGVINPTPLQFSQTFSDLVGTCVLLKPESLQKTGSFKVRGAYFKMSRLTREEAQRGVITFSSGNHAQGLAFAAEKLGIRATVVMPTWAVRPKVEATRGYGAEVILFGDTSFESMQKAIQLSLEHGYTFVHPFDDPEIIAGQGTIGLEVLEENPAVGTIVVPIGGGGLIAGIALAVKNVKPDVKVIGVQPETSCSMKASLEAGKPITVPGTQTIADGLTAKKPGELTFQIVKRFVDDVVCVSDGEILDATKLLFERARLVVEPSGAASLAAVLHERTAQLTGDIVVVLSGGNINPAVIRSLFGG